MDIEKKQRFIDAGIDVADALNRFMGNENMLERFLGKFTADQNYQKLVDALDRHDEEAALAASHTLKGVCGNLSMTKLFDLLTAQVKAFRDGDFDGAKAMMDDITAVYNEITAAING